MADDRKLSDRLADEFADGSADLTRAPAVAAIPTPTEEVPSLVRAVKAIKQVLDSIRGVSGPALDKALTARDLINDGALAFSPSTGLGAGQTIINTVSTGISGGAGYTDPRSAPATPPTPSGVAAAGGFRSVIVSWSDPNIANHAYTEVWRHTANNLALAVQVGQPTANVFEDTAATPGVTYYYWVRFCNTAGTLGAYSSVVSAGALVVANADIGALVVQAANLADNAVTAAKILDSQITAAKFATNVEPITIVPSGGVPGTKSTTQIFVTSTGKLYRWTGSAYTPSVDAADITVGQIATSQIVDNAITSVKIAAGQVTAAKTAIAAIDSSTGNLTANSVTATQIAAGQVTAGKLATDSVAAANIQAGAVTTSKMTAGTIDASVLTAGSITTSLMAANSINADRLLANSITSGKLAVGAITSNELASGAVTAGKIAANTIVAGDGVIANAAITNAMIDRASVSKLAVTSADIISVNADTITTGALNANLITTGTLNTARIAAGSIDASKINSNGLTIRDNSGNLILGVGSPLSAAYVPQTARNNEADFQANRFWNFDGGTDSWTSSGCNIIPTTSYLRVESTSSDPVIESPTGQNLVGARNSIIRARIRRLGGSGWDGTVYYSTSARPGTSGSYYRTVWPDPTITNQWVVVEWDMGFLTVGGTEWITSSINHIRLDLGISTSDIFDIDWVAIGDYAPSSFGAEFGRSIYGQIDSSNVSTYIASAAINLAQINTASIGSLSAISANLGTVTAGTLSAVTLSSVTGTFGALTVASGGNIKQGQTAWNTGVGFWLGDFSGTPRMSLGNPSGPHLKWDGTDLTINTPTFDTFSASISGGTVTTHGSTRTVSVTGGKSPYTYSWLFQPSGGSLNATVFLGGASTATATFSGNGGALTGTFVGTATCFVRDANGRVTLATVDVSFSFTSPIVPGGGGGDGGPD